MRPKTSFVKPTSAEDMAQWLVRAFAAIVEDFSSQPPHGGPRVMAKKLKKELNIQMVPQVSKVILTLIFTTV